MQLFNCSLGVGIFLETVYCAAFEARYFEVQDNCLQIYLPSKPLLEIPSPTLLPFIFIHNRLVENMSAAVGKIER